MMYVSRSANTTSRLAKNFLKIILKRKTERALVVGLVGELGAGKTTFTKSFIKALGVQERVTSPTFLIMRSFGLPAGANFRKVYHIDAYRVEAKNLLKLGFKKIINNPKNIVIIEWADRVAKIIPRISRWIEFHHGLKKNERTIKII